MKNKDFELLLSAVRGKDLWGVRGEECWTIIKDLTKDDADFEEICYGTTKIIVQIASLPSGTMAQTTDGQRPGQYKITIDKGNWERNPNFSKAGLRHILAHELLHILTGLGDRDTRFKQAARERGIDLWRV